MSMDDDYTTNLTPAAIMALAAGDIGNALVAMTPGGIEAQEAQGQRDLVRSEMLPKDDRGQRDKLEAMGIVYGDDANDIFVHVQLPKGWRKRPTDHPMWSDLLDDKGRVRAKIFFKAAFYDRSAHIDLCTRYTVEWRPNDVRTVMDGETELYRAVGEALETDAGPWVAGKRASDEARAWIADHYPDWQDPTAYWDEQ